MNKIEIIDKFFDSISFADECTIAIENNIVFAKHNKILYFPCYFNELNNCCLTYKAIADNQHKKCCLVIDDRLSEFQLMSIWGTLVKNKILVRFLDVSTEFLYNELVLKMI